MWYVVGVALFCVLVFGFVYAVFIRKDPTCFDGTQNGDERGVDCGGGCRLVCPFDVQEPTVKWSRSFKVTQGSYNAVAYIENRNLFEGTRSLRYTFKLFDASGSLIAERSGITSLPPDSVYPVFEGRIMTGDAVPARTVLTFDPITRWERLSDDRTVFAVKNRALARVDSTPRLDALLANTSLVDHRDVEIVATIFDAAGTALTASRTVVPLFEARTEQRVVFTWPEPIAKTLRSCEVPTDVIMAIDLSGSMDNDGGVPPEPITSVLRAADSFISRLGIRDQIGLSTFATKGQLAQQLSMDKTAVARAVGALRIDPREQTGGTNAGEALAAAAAELQSHRHSNDARKVIVLFTDGKTNEPEPHAEEYALAEARKAKDDDVIIFTIGLGTDINQAFLEAVASDVSHRYVAADTRSLDTIYRSVSTAICEQGPAVIEIVPKVIGDLNDGQPDR